MKIRGYIIFSIKVTIESMQVFLEIKKMMRHTTILKAVAVQQEHSNCPHILETVQSRQKCINSSKKITERARPRLLHHKSQQPRQHYYIGYISEEHLGDAYGHDLLVPSRVPHRLERR
jgi:hypothetical protein